MILGIGTDLADIDYFEQCIQDSKTKVIEKTFTSQEIATSERGPTPKSHRLAGRFAAKEAFYKALNQIFPQNLQKIAAQEIEVCLDHLGRPYLSIHGYALEIMERCKVKKTHLSISHEKNYALAFVILESGE